jgi:hypothetical protein
MSLFLLGSLLPDILLRGGRLFFLGSPHRDFVELYLAPLHTPFATALVCLAIAQFFHSEVRLKSFVLLYSGCLTHFILDLFQRTIVGFGFTAEPLDGYHWLYPFSWFDFQIGLFWAEDAPYALLLLVPLAAWICSAPGKKWVRIGSGHGN